MNHLLSFDFFIVWLEDSSNSETWIESRSLIWKTKYLHVDSLMCNWRNCTLFVTAMWTIFLDSFYSSPWCNEFILKFGVVTHKIQNFSLPIIGLKLAQDKWMNFWVGLIYLIWMQNLILINIAIWLFLLELLSIGKHSY